MRTKEEDLPKLEWHGDSPERLGSFIRHRREELGLSMREVAYMVGVAEANVCQIELGIRIRSSFFTVCKIFVVLDISLDYFWDDDYRQYHHTGFFNEQVFHKNLGGGF